MLNNVDLVVLGQVKSENSSLPVTVRVSKTRVLVKCGGAAGVRGRGCLPVGMAWSE